MRRPPPRLPPHLPAASYREHESMTAVSHRTIVGSGALVALSLAVLAAFAVSATPPERHLDGAGPLASLNGPGSEMMAVDPTAAGHPTSWTYGLRLCLSSGSDPAILESVAPTVSVGTGYRFLGAGIRAFTPTQTHTGVIGVSPWPPPRDVIPDPLSAVTGYAVTTPCSMDPHAPYTELLVGLGLQGDDGGGWHGIDIAYSVAGHHRILAVDRDLFICGRSVAAQCTGPGPSRGPVGGWNGWLDPPQYRHPRRGLVAQGG